MQRWLKFSLLVLGLLVLAATPLAKQFDTGAIEGIITNDRGPIANASIEARNLMFGDILRGESEIDGHYKVDDLRPGRYSLWVRALGHDSTWIPRIVVERGQTAHRDVRLDRSPMTPTAF